MFRHWPLSILSATLISLRCSRNGVQTRWRSITKSSDGYAAGLEYEALAAAAGKYPEEALQWTEETLPDIRTHYEYLLNHEDIVGMLGALKRSNR